MLKYLQRIGYSLGWMFTAALLLRLLLAFSFSEYMLPIPMDEGGRIAEALVRGEGFSNPLAVSPTDDFTLAFSLPTGPTAWRAPVYPLLEAAVFAVFGIYTLESAVALQALNSLFSALTCFPVFGIAEESLGRRAALVAGWAWAFFPYAAIHSTRYVFDTAFTTLVLSVVFLAALRMPAVKKVRAWLGFGLLCAFSVLSHSGIVIVLPFLWAWQLSRLGWRNRGSLLRVGAAVVAFAAGVAPWTARNYAAFGRFIPLRSNLGLELWVGNVAKDVEGFAYLLHPTRNLAEAQRMQRMGEVAYMEAKQREAWELIRENPANFILRTVWRFFAYWTSQWSPRYERLLSSHLKRTDVMFYTTVSLLGLAGLVRLWRERRELAWPFLLVLVFFPLVYYVTAYGSRHRHPMDPLLVVLGTYAFLNLAPRLRSWAGYTQNL